ncbi:MAG TPA: proton-translocating transhydrogenase family protein [Solirubrobacterales bacterium]
MDLLTELAILVLAAFVGFEVISKVPNTLHTPLMSGTNAIHGIVLLGGVLVIASAEGVRNMAPGSVIVDLAAETGGNCELTQPGQTVVEGGVKVIGSRNLPSEMPAPASQLYAKNLENLLGLIVTEEGEVKVDFEDDIIAAACITQGGEIKNERAAK